MTRLPSTPAQRQAVARQMTPGAAGGRTPLVAPTPAVAPVRIVAPLRTEIVTFSVKDPMDVRTSGAYTVILGGLIRTITSVDDAGTGDTEFDILLNGTPVGSGVTVPAAEDDGQEDDLPGRAVPGDKLQFDITAAGGHPKLVVQVVMES